MLNKQTVRKHFNYGVTVMKISCKKLLSVLSISVIIFISGNGFAAEIYPMEARLKQCEIAFKKAHSGELVVTEAVMARQQHLKLVSEILQELNQRNAEIRVNSGEVLTQKEIVNNFHVMGRLLEMLAADHQAPKTIWDFAY